MAKAGTWSLLNSAMRSAPMAESTIVVPSSRRVRRSSRMAACRSSGTWPYIHTMTSPASRMPETS